MPGSPEIEARLSALRAIAQSRELTNEEAKEAIALVRNDRVSASYSAKGAKAKADGAKKATPMEALDKLKALLGGPK